MILLATRARGVCSSGKLTKDVQQEEEGSEQEEVGSEGEDAEPFSAAWLQKQVHVCGGKCTVATALLIQFSM